MSFQQCGNLSCPKKGLTALQAGSRCRTVGYCSRECQASSWPTHKATCQRQNYIIQFHLAPDDITDPAVIRTMSCPADASFCQSNLCS